MKKLALSLSFVLVFVAGIMLGRVDMSTLGAVVIAVAVEDNSLELGAQAPDFDLPGVDGRRHSLAEYQDAEVLAIVFTCNHCPTAQAYEARLKALAADYPPSQLALVAISPNDDKAVRLDELGYSDLNDSLPEMKLRAAHAEFNFPYLYDGEQQQVSRAYGPLATPHVFIFDKARKLRYKGRIDSSENPLREKTHDARDAIDTLLAGSEPLTTATRVFGCSVKWAGKRDGVIKADAAWAARTVSLDSLSPDAVATKILNSDDWILVNVWATWCAPCKQEFPALVETHRMYRGRGLETVTISLDASSERGTVMAFLQQQQAAMTNFLSTTTSVDELSMVLDPAWQGAVPYTLLIAPGGKVVYRQHGPFDTLELRREIVSRIKRTYF